MSYYVYITKSNCQICKSYSTIDLMKLKYFIQTYTGNDLLHINVRSNCLKELMDLHPSLIQTDMVPSLVYIPEGLMDLKIPSFKFLCQSGQIFEDANTLSDFILQTSEVNISLDMPKDFFKNTDHSMESITPTEPPTDNNMNNLYLLGII